MRRGWALAPWLALAWPTGETSAATSAYPVGISVTACPAAAVTEHRLVELLRTELAPRPLVPGDTVVRGLLVEISLCAGSADAALVVVRQEGNVVAERGVDLSDVAGDSRARTLAVAVAELVAAREAPATLALPPAPAPAPAAPAAPSPTVPLPPTPAPAPAPVPPEGSAAPLRIGAGAALRSHFAPLTPLVGPWLSFGTERAYGEALLLTSTHSVPLGTVTTSSAVVAAGVELLSLARRPALALRIRGELGVSWAAAKPARAGIQELVRAAPQAAAAAECSLQPPLFGDLSGEVRAVAGVARGFVPAADGTAVATTDGPFVGLTLGLRYRL